MSFNRLKFDNDSYRHVLKESIGPGEYMLDKLTPCDPCFMPDTRADHFAGATADRNLIDIESELMNITREASDCPADKYYPGVYKEPKIRVYKECSGLIPEDTRLSNGPCTLRCTGWNRWEFLPCGDEQKHALIPFDYNIDNRALVKKNHRPCVPNPICQKNALPPRENSAIEYDWSSRYTQAQQVPWDVQLKTCNSIRKM